MGRREYYTVSNTRRWHRHRLMTVIVGCGGAVAEWDIDGDFLRALSTRRRQRGTATVTFRTPYGRHSSSRSTGPALYSTCKRRCCNHSVVVVVSLCLRHLQLFGRLRFFNSHINNNIPRCCRRCCRRNRSLLRCMVWPAAESVAASAVAVTARGKDERRCQWRRCLCSEGARGARELGRQRPSSAANDCSGCHSRDTTATGIQAARNVQQQGRDRRPRRWRWWLWRHSGVTVARRGRSRASA